MHILFSRNKPKIQGHGKFNFKAPSERCYQLGQSQIENHRSKTMMTKDKKGHCLMMKVLIYK